MIREKPRAESLHTQSLRSKVQKGESLEEAYRAMREEAEATGVGYDKFLNRTLEEIDRAYKNLKGQN